MTQRNRTGWTLIAALMAAVATAAFAAENPVAGIVISVQGKPMAKSADGKTTTALKLNDMVHEGDVVKTKKGELVGIAFTGGPELRINENSSFRIENGGGGNKATSVFTDFGEAWTRMIHGFSGMQVRTPLAVAAVRGTEADIDIAGGPMTVKVYEGLVDVTNSKGTTPLKAGQLTQVGGAGQAPQTAKAMTSADYGTWHNGLKAANLNKSLKLLNAASDKQKNLEIEMRDRDGSRKKIELHLEKK